MRKKCVWIILVAVLGFALIAGILFFPRHKDKIALTEGLQFGMVPLEVRMHYGAPDEQETNTASSEMTYVYSRTLCGQEATMYITFVRTTFRYELNRVTVQFETSKTQTDGLYEQVLEMCREQYRGIDSYQETSEANEMKINISDGADLLECKIKEAQTSVQVVITKVW